MKSTQVSLKERAYPIFIGKDIFQQIGPILKKHQLVGGHALIVSQKEIAAYHEVVLTALLDREGIEHSTFLAPSTPSSESAKSQKVFLKLIQKIASCDGKNKSLFLIALGGGVVGDLTGFTAAIYRRGIPYVQIPTTLTAQVDSAIGGKTGIDLAEGKNLLGAIYQPRLVLSDTSLLSSLPERHWTDGFAEVIKYGIIKDPALFSLLEKRGKEEIRSQPKLLEKVIFRCAKIKARVVEKDEWDKKGIRIVLNFGHTIGHALEATSKFSRQLTHGEAISIGMLVACDIAERQGILRDRGLTQRLEKILIRYGLPVFFKGFNLEPILKAVGYDKKSEAGKNRFVLPEALGRTILAKEIPSLVIEEALKKRKA